MGGEDPQKLKKIAAVAYDYDNDPRWADYWSNILITPNMASRSDVVNHFKQKFYQRYIDPHLVVEPMNTYNTSQQSRPSVPPSQSSSSSTQNNHSHPRDSGSAGRTSGASAAPPPNSTSLRWNRETIQFSFNAWKPRTWNLQALRVWFQSVVVTKDFIYCLTFVSSHLCLKFALIPILVRALKHVAKFLRRNFSRSTLYRKYLEEVCVWVDSNATTLGILSSQAEIGVGLLLIFSLLSWQCSIIHIFMYWQLLKLMYHAPASAGYHQSSWSRIGRTVNPFIQRYAPFLSSPISAIQRWWFR